MLADRKPSFLWPVRKKLMTLRIVDVGATAPESALSRVPSGFGRSASKIAKAKRCLNLRADKGEREAFAGG